ncbi:hypothetical protein BDA99DRAFT_571576 [Phascolomyces articulosus]|uniref:Uncharacterized protein n=1 Tax=Phascolomyces articulosus TaxID=60185 RepID=A0AAD5PFV3_9FUNG|nr:hypothetical protein BDA99DRAFT_571576 [Phascolomyces articulosus]
MDISEGDSLSDYENVCPPIATFSRLEGGFANLGIHSNSSRGIRNRTRAVQPTSRPCSQSAMKLREIIGCNEDSDSERHPNLDMVLDHDNKISFENNDTPLSTIYSQQSEDSTDLDDDLLLSTPPPLIGKLFEDDFDEFRDDTADWIAQIYHDEDGDVSETEQLPPTMEHGYNKENQQDKVEDNDYRRKNTKRTYHTHTDQKQEDHYNNNSGERRPLGQMPLDDWPSTVIIEHEKKRQPLEMVASTSTGSNSSTSTIGSHRRFVRSLSPPSFSRKGKERALSPEN